MWVFYFYLAVVYMHSRSSCAGTREGGFGSERRVRRCVCAMRACLSMPFTSIPREREGGREMREIYPGQVRPRAIDASRHLSLSAADCTTLSLSLSLSPTTSVCAQQQTVQPPPFLSLLYSEGGEGPPRTLLQVPPKLGASLERKVKAPDRPGRLFWGCEQIG